MISLAIANYGRSEMTIESFIQVMNNDLIGEIIILDDCSDVEIYSKLQNLINGLVTNKVFLYRNTENLGPFLNKHRVVEKCKNDWVILLDCDNILDNEYIERVSKLNKEKDVLYCPEVLYKLNKEGVNWTYKKFSSLTINKENAKQYIDDSTFGILLNTGNYFFHRQKYLDTVNMNKVDMDLCKLDSFYFSYLWLLAGNRIRVIPELNYIHRVQADGYYSKNMRALLLVREKIKNKIKIL